MRRLRPRLLAAVGLAAALPLSWGCTEEPLTGSDPDQAPGPSVETREVELEASALSDWKDTALVGFAIPGDAGFQVVATEQDLRSRALARFAVPDSVTQFGDTLFVDVDAYEDASLFVRIDTARSALPPLPFTLEMRALERSFEAAEASWTEAATGEPWAMPGGDLGPRLASFTLEEAADTLRMDFDVPDDSLLQAWAQSGGEPGVAMLVDAPGARIRLTTLLLEFDALVDEVEAPFPQSRGPDPGIFIYTPAQPAPMVGLRVGGLPAWRSYFEFALPDVIAGIRIEDAAVSHAELVFRPLVAPPAPFAPGSSLSGQGVQLLGDPFEFGAKTPIGGGGSLLSLNPDSLAMGVALRLDVTEPVNQRIDQGQASVPIRLGLRGTPDAQSLGFWEFGSIDHPTPSLRPALRLILSAPPTFEVP